MKIQNFFLAIVFFLFPHFVSAQTLVISDIDDTLKESQILDTWGTIGNALLGREAFWQMPELMTAIHAQGAEVVYLSMAPVEIMEKAHRQFLRLNRFPNGLLILPSFRQRTNHKVRWIQKLVAEKKPKLVILLGDNGEKDPQIFQQMTESLKNTGVEILSFVRINYNYKKQGSMILNGQRPFVTAAEVALPLYARRLLTLDDANMLVKNSITRPGMAWLWKEKFHKAATLGLPDWIDCRTHLPLLMEFYPEFAEAETLSKKIQARCSYVMAD